MHLFSISDKTKYFCILEYWMLMKSLLVIGDVHGLKLWKPIVEAHLDCKVVFLGDYLDPYEYLPREKTLANLRQIIDFKKNNRNVVMLLGNHDIHYLYPNAPAASRFDPDIFEDAHRLLAENRHLFQFAFQIDDTIFTHAGISQEWFEKDFCGNISHNISEQLNNPNSGQMESIFRVGYVRGGKEGDKGGIFWADRAELKDVLSGFRQIVGHNRVDDITVVRQDEKTVIIFCDCLRNDKYLILDNS